MATQYLYRVNTNDSSGLITSLLSLITFKLRIALVRVNYITKKEIENELMKNIKEPSLSYLRGYDILNNKKYNILSELVLQCYGGALAQPKVCHKNTFKCDG